MFCHGRLLAHCPLSQCCSIRRSPTPHNIAICFRHIGDGKWLYQRDFTKWYCLLWFRVPWLSTCLIKRGPLCHPFNWFFHGKFKGFSILHHGHVHLFDMNRGMAILHSTSTSPLFLIVHRDARFWLPEGINLWAKTCQHAWLIIQLNFFQRNFPRNVTGKCIPHADTCCSSFAMNTHTSCMFTPLSPIPSFSTWKETITWMSFLAAYISSSSAHGVLSKDGCLSNFGNGFYQPLCYPG